MFRPRCRSMVLYYGIIIALLPIAYHAIFVHHVVSRFVVFCTSVVGLCLYVSVPLLYVEDDHLMCIILTL